MTSHQKPTLHSLLWSRTLGVGEWRKAFGILIACIPQGGLLPTTPRAKQCAFHQSDTESSLRILSALSQTRLGKGSPNRQRKQVISGNWCLDSNSDSTIWLSLRLRHRKSSVCSPPAGEQQQSDDPTWGLGDKNKVPGGIPGLRRTD